MTTKKDLRTFCEEWVTAIGADAFKNWTVEDAQKEIDNMESEILETVEELTATKLHEVVNDVIEDFTK